MVLWENYPTVVCAKREIQLSNQRERGSRTPTASLKGKLDAVSHT